MSLFFTLFLLFSVEVLAAPSSGHCQKTSKKPRYDLKKHRANVKRTASKLLKYLKVHARRAAIVSRAGGDLSKEEFSTPSIQKYTHAGIVWKSSQDGRWRFKHLLNVCEGPKGQIFVQSLFEFFDDDPHFYDFYIGIPDHKLQDAIAKVLESKIADKVHNPRYSKIANPFSNEYLNSNGWLLRVMTAAESGSSNEKRLIDYYTKKGYMPSQVYVGASRRVGSLLMSNVTILDHSAKEKKNGWFNFISAASLYSYLEHNGRLSKKKEICHDLGCNIPLTELNRYNDKP